MLAHSHPAYCLDALVSLAADKQNVVFVLTPTDPHLSICCQLLTGLPHHVAEPIFEWLGEINRWDLLRARVSGGNLYYFARRGGNAAVAFRETARAGFGPAMIDALNALLRGMRTP